MTSTVGGEPPPAAAETARPALRLAALTYKGGLRGAAVNGDATRIHAAVVAIVLSGRRVSRSSRLALAGWLAVTLSSLQSLSLSFLSSRLSHRESLRLRLRLRHVYVGWGRASRPG